MNDKNQGLYSTEIIANLLNISARRVEQLTQKKIIPKAGRGVYDLGSTVQSYIRYLQGICSGAIKSGEPSELDKRLLEAKVLERESKARQAKLRADAMEQELADKKLRSKIQTLPQEISYKIQFNFPDGLPQEKRREYIEQIVKRAIDDVLNGCEYL